MTSDADRNIRQNVARWLEDDKWQVLELSGPNWIWGWGATDDMRGKLIVWQPEDRNDLIIVQAGVSLVHSSDERIAALPDSERAKLLRGLLFEILRFGLDKNGIQFPTERIEILQRVFLDDFSKTIFLKKVSKLRNGVLLLRGLLENEEWT